jgi:cysteine desulfuration protein SufE
MTAARSSNTVPANPSIDRIIEDFAFLDDWDDRYRYIIELGKGMPPLSEAARTPENKVRGCASQVWLDTRVGGDRGNPLLHFAGDSDAMIVRGLVAIAIALFDGKPAREILRTDAQGLFDKLGLSEHLTAQRSNGLRALVDRIKADAEASLTPA